MRTPTTSRRVFAALIAAAWLVGPALELLHAEHAHRFCAEHLRIEEGGAEGGAVGPVADAAGLTALPAVAAVPSHDPCAFLAVRRQELLPAKTVAFLSGPAAAPVAAVVESARGHLPVPVLARAPKSSPPLS